jgi:hypothetical protein
MMAQYRISASRSLQASKTPKSTTCARFATDASRSLLPQHVSLVQIVKMINARYRYELAEIDLTHAIAADSENIDFLVNRSQCYYETREFDAAVMILLLLMLLRFSSCFRSL